MIKTIIAIVWFSIFTKLLVFWVWLWQLKEYHWGRLKAHFETQKTRKLLFSFHGFRYPKLTKKVIAVLISGILFEIFILFYIFSLSENLFYLSLLLLIILAPIISSLLVLFFQIPTLIFIKRALKKAKRKRKQFKDLMVIGITGSYGKTSTKEILATILSERFNVLKTKKHVNAEIGIAQTILKELKPEHQVFIAEVGAYNTGKIKEVCRMLQPKIGILTGISGQHLSTFGSQENIIKTKYELIETLPKDGMAIFNCDNKYCLGLYKKTKAPEKSAVSCISNVRKAIVEDLIKVDIWVEDVKTEKEFVSFKISARDGNSADFKVNLLGAHNIENIVLAVYCAKKLGMGLEEISRACLKIKPEQGGMRFLKKNGLMVIDSSYSANPDGVIADLEYLKLYQGRKIIVMPCLIELGKAAKEVHQRIGRKIAEVCDLAIVATRDYFKEIKKGAETGSLSPLLIEKAREIVDKLKNFCKTGDVILLEGRVPKELIEFFKK